MNNQTQEALKMAIGIAEKAIKHWKNNIDDLDAKQWEKIDKYEDKLYDLKEALDTKQVCGNAAPAKDTETMAVAIALQEQIRQLKEQPVSLGDFDKMSKEECVYYIEDLRKEIDLLLDDLKNCNERINELEAQLPQIGDAEIRQMLNDIEYYQKRVEELESQKQEYDINEMIDKITPENLQEPRSIMESFDKMLAEKLVYYKKKRTAQPLSDDEIQKTWYNLYPLDENNLWTDMLEGEHLRKFARAIEQAHGIGEKYGQAHNSSNEWNISGISNK